MGYCTQWTDLGLFPGARGPPGDCCRLVVTRIIADASTAFATGGGYIGGAHIGFMVSTSFVRDAEITLRLPQAEASISPNTLDEVLDITVTQTGSYIVNGRPLVNS